MNKYTVAVLVKNHFGVLNRVTSMFRRRQFNISALTVSETESNEYSRITVIFVGDEMNKQQLINQLYKLPDVCFIKELSDDESVIGELVLIKMEIQPECFDAMKKDALSHDGKIMDFTDKAVIFQKTGTSDQIDDFINLMRQYSILEICRTGIVALEKGDDTIRKSIL
ncbi:MAG: acetolactate synthase small subunit [Ruminococcaceae bacterium]|nr:acetolactate synthase small subunit [Oscillospiraceae bacterium]